MVWLMVMFLFKHYIADFPLQGYFPYMLGKFKEKNWAKPLASHCLVHAALTFIISITYSGKFINSVLYALIDFSIHFIVDRIKASPNYGGRYKSLAPIKLSDGSVIFIEGVDESVNAETGKVDSFKPHFVRIPSYRMFKENFLYWNNIGIDQLAHGLTDVLIIYLLTK